MASVIVPKELKTRERYEQQPQQQQKCTLNVNWQKETCAQTQYSCSFKRLKLNVFFGVT